MKKWMIGFGFMFVAVAIYIHIPGGRLWRKFKESILLARTKMRGRKGRKFISVEDICNLPQPLKRYFETCGYIGKPLMQNVCITFRDVVFSIDPDKTPVKISYQQYNFLEKPNRFAFINTKMYGIPFQGLDYFYDGEGYFEGHLAKLIPVVQSKSSSEAMKRASLVTFLADAILFPSVFLSDNITCLEMSQNTIKAQLTGYGTNVEGVFCFNKKNEIIAFTCEGRQYDNGKVEPFPAKWTVEVGDYRLDPSLGILRPYKTKAIWNLPEGDYVYFDSSQVTIAYDVTQAPHKAVRP